jgi:hypothetical protein
VRLTITRYESRRTARLAYHQTEGFERLAGLNQGSGFSQAHSIFPK